MVSEPTDVGESRLVILQAGVSIRFRAKSSSDLRRAQFVPNTARTCGHSRLPRVSHSFAHKETA